MSDPTTQSNYQDIASTHVDLKWDIDWERNVVSGTVIHTLVAKGSSVNHVIFDTSHLDVSSVEIGGNQVSFTLGPGHPVMGSSLSIPLTERIGSGTAIIVKIDYKTTNKCAALQWLDKEQTAGKKFAYLFSQCQPIYARTLLPVQDTPSVKITYNATIRSVLPVVMSAIRVSPPSDGLIHAGNNIGVDVVEYVYKQPVPIPSYLIAIASGNLVYRGFPKLQGKDWTSGVWTEPEALDAAYWEFSEDTARFLSQAEEILVPYNFGVYDLLVLPPSFPYGGMENACLTFLTPTLVTGDRTLVDVVAHELTHSYFGNGVTHKDASSFWLNEGWTTYFERVLAQYLHSPAERDFSYIIGAKGLATALKRYEDQPKYQRLVIDFEPGEDPDDAYSDIPYEKGANLLLYLERILGGLDVFLPYARDYVKTFIGKSISTEDWKGHLYSYFRANYPAKLKILDGVDWNAWFYGEGLELPVTLQYDTTLATQAYDLATRWQESRSKQVSKLDFKPEDLESLNGNQIIVFLERLSSDEQPLPATHIHHLASTYGIDKSPNTEIRLRFYLIALESKGTAASDFAPAAAEWLVDKKTGVKGRMKFCRPVFRALNAIDGDLAKKTFEDNKWSFHPIARKLIEKDLGLVDKLSNVQN